MQINKNNIATSLIYLSVFMIVMYVFLQLAIVLGVEKKELYKYAWDLIAGGSTGALMGLLFFLMFGAIGWVSGAIYGSIGLISLILGGALGGLGLGSLVHIARNPDRYEINWLILVSVLFVGVLISRYLAQMARIYCNCRFGQEQGGSDAEQRDY